MSFVVGAAVFVMTSTVLIHFLVQPPGATTGLQDATLKGKGYSALGVLLGTPGYPTKWDQQAETIDSLRRLGLLEDGATLRLDPDKFDALAKGSYLNPSSSNGYVDYDEAKRALGLDGFDFHIRSAPAFEAFDPASYGIDGMTDYHVGYIGHWNGAIESEESKSERYALQRLSSFIKYDNGTRLTVTGLGDAYKDDSNSLRSVLTPLLGANPAQTVLNAGSGTKYDFTIVNASVYSSNFAPGVSSTLSRALVLSDTSGNLGYTKSREIRAILGTATMTGLVTADLTWNEWVDTDNAGDYGWIEASPDGGVTWYPLTNTALLRSQDAGGIQPTTWTPRLITIAGSNCGPCVGAANVQIAAHWLGDNTNPGTSKGWIMDDVVLAPTTTTAFHKTFERPEFDLLIVGSNVDQNAMTPAEVKYGIRDYVNIYGGRLIVLGGQNNVNWLQPLYSVGIQSASPGVSTPDTTHPLLTVPNELSWQNYNYNNVAWEFGTSSAANLFNMVVGAGAGNTQHILTASRQAAFSANGQEGVVMLTTYLPFTMEGDQALRFLANMLMFGRYHYLYMDFGPPVPSDSSVASVTRTALMNKIRVGDPSYLEMGMIMYVWPGGDAATVAASAALPSAPLNPALVSADVRLTLNWTKPLSDGSTPVTGYNIYRSTGPALEVYYRGVCNCTSWIDTNVSNGVTYYYNVTAVNSIGQGVSSVEFSGTPSKLSTAPQGLTATAGVVQNSLSWTQPADYGGSSISGYSVYRNLTGQPSTMALHAAAGNTLSWIDTAVVAGYNYTYYVTAHNAAGESPASGTTVATPLATPNAPTLTATGGYRSVALTWTVPGGTTPDTYRVYVGTASNNAAYYATVAHPTLTMTHSGLNDTETWYYRVSAVSGGVEGPQSAVANAATLATPGAPAPLAVTNVTAGAGNLTLTWSPPAGGADSYKVYAGDSSAALVLVQSGVTTTTWTETGLGNNRTRYYAVSAVLSGVEGTKSSTESGTTNSVPHPPVLASVASGTGAAGRILVAYTPGYDGGTTILYYKVYRTEAGGGGGLTFHAGDYLAVGAVYITGLTPGASYDVALAAVTSAGESALSGSRTAVASAV